MTNIADIYNDDAEAYWFDRHTAIVKLHGGAAITLVPCDDDTSLPQWENHDATAKIRQACFDGDAPDEHSTLGHLLVWASRRMPREALDPPDAEDEGAFVMARPTSDFQSCCGHPFDRRLIRECLQAFVENREPPMLRIKIRVAPFAGGHVMHLDGGRVQAFLMSAKPGTEVGADPMPVFKGQYV